MSRSKLLSQLISVKRDEANLIWLILLAVGCLLLSWFIVSRISQYLQNNQHARPRMAALQNTK